MADVLTNETSGEVAQANDNTTDKNVFQTVTGLFSKGLDLGMAIVNPTKKDESDETPKEPKKIMGIPQPVFIGGVAIVGLIGAVIVVKKMKK